MCGYTNLTTVENTYIYCIYMLNTASRNNVTISPLFYFLSLFLYVSISILCVCVCVCLHVSSVCTSLSLSLCLCRLLWCRGYLTTGRKTAASRELDYLTMHINTYFGLLFPCGISPSYRISRKLIWLGGKFWGL